MNLVQNAIKNITYKSKIFPEEEFRILSENPTEAIPYLRAAIEKAIEERENLDAEYQLHFYAFYLLAQFQDREFFPKIMEFVSLPGDVLSSLIGDAITSGLAEVLYHTYNGDLALLKRSIMNPDIDEFVRDGMMSVLRELYMEGRLEKEEWQAFIRKVVHGEVELGDFFYAEVASTICRCRFIEMLSEIRYLLEQDKIDLSVVGRYDSYVDLMFEYRDYKENFHEKPLNAADVLRKWAMFSETNREPQLSKEQVEKLFQKIEKEYGKSGTRSIKVGRNDPCPCGSGRKYKHCCLNKSKTSIDLIESAQDRKRWLQDYPAAAKERKEGHIYLEDFFDSESIEIDKLLYLALMHRPGFAWQRDSEEEAAKKRRLYLTEAFSKFSEKTEKEEIRTFQEYDEKYSIHYRGEEWMGVLEELLRENGDTELYKRVSDCRKSMKNT